MVGKPPAHRNFQLPGNHSNAKKVLKPATAEEQMGVIARIMEHIALVSERGLPTCTINMNADASPNIDAKVAGEVLNFVGRSIIEIVQGINVRLVACEELFTVDRSLRNGDEYFLSLHTLTKFIKAQGEWKLTLDDLKENSAQDAFTAYRVVFATITEDGKIYYQVEIANTKLICGGSIFPPVAKDHRVAFLHEFFYQANEDVYVSHVFRHTLIGLLFLEGLEIPAATEAYESLEMAAAQMVRRRLNQVEAIEGIVRGAVKLGRDKFYLTLTEFRKLFSSQQNIRKTIVGVEAERLFEYILEMWEKSTLLVQVVVDGEEVCYGPGRVGEEIVELFAKRASTQLTGHMEMRKAQADRALTGAETRVTTLENDLVTARAAVAARQEEQVTADTNLAEIKGYDLAGILKLLEPGE